jgi:pyruvate/2-oxoglutarate dehydrogenase complex dihydrolipoamide dehydrogenase (E3) component
MSTIQPSTAYSIHPQSHPLSSLPTHEYDLIVLGSGPTGRALAVRTSKKGNLSVLLVENELVGGECHFWACVPSKAMLRPAEAVYSALGISGAKEMISKPDPNGAMVDMPGVWARRDKYTDKWEDMPIVKMLEGAKVTIVRGYGRIAGVKKVVLESTSFTEGGVEIMARYAVCIAGGSEPIMPPISGLVGAKPWTPRDATGSRVVPDHLIILGAGAVGTEMATAYRSYGAKITLITSSAEVLPKQEPEAGKRVRESLVSRGATVLLSTKVTAVERNIEGIKVTLSTGDSISGSELLVAAGRRPRTSDIGLETIGLEGLKGFALPVDDSMAVKSVPEEWLFAIGDMNGRAMTTHMGKYQARVAADNIIARVKGTEITSKGEGWNKYTAFADRTAISQIIFTDPNVACVGLTLAEAKKTGRSVREVATPFKVPGAAYHEDGYSGWAQWVVDRETNQLVGATFVGRDAADLLHASTVAVAGGVPLNRLWHAVPGFPTLSEVYLDLMEACGL